MSIKPSRILILGYGEMGHAMEYLLGSRHHLSIHDARTIEGLPPINLQQEAELADFVLFCVPTSAHIELLDKLAPYLKKQCICLSIAKGLDEQGMTPAQLFQQTLKGQQPFCLLYGPMISEEIRADRYAFAELGSSGISIYHKVQFLFNGTKLKINHNSDTTGISWSVILKNVYAIAFGMADELELGDNVRGYLSVTALSELRSIVTQMGGKRVSALYLAGLGDLITTATSAGSHHHELGRMLAHGKTEGISGEGIHTLLMVEKYHLFDIPAYPLFSLIRDIVHEPSDVAQRFTSFLEQVKQ